MLCAKCNGENVNDAHRCAHCGASLSVGLLEVIRGNLPEKIYFLKPRSYSLGRARHNDLALTEPSISKSHARIAYESGSFRYVLFRLPFASLAWTLTFSVPAEPPVLSVTVAR